VAKKEDALAKPTTCPFFFPPSLADTSRFNPPSFFFSPVKKEKTIKGNGNALLSSPLLFYKQRSASNCFFALSFFSF